MIDIEAAPKVPREVVTPLKPSEALRLGCLVTTPAIGAFNTADGGACALAAMLIGFGGKAYDVWPDAYQAFRDGPLLPIPGDPNLPSAPMSPGSIVMWLNDHAHWPRERIADWLESLGL